ncbi:hypothetical protein FRB94_012739 [Tulasnella sp. JGI-2019a]|nr:hypothetical protein FRB94_012739 [Tulasnella sp. JGI-2019a]KAG9018451.1 hypothetical protein FRB93_000154 [Tulasnella sp. JGI-2019a]KAG9031822.1 hypothetical protein FRB95_002267 [Tulasnella sp. JGI-2019a]
MASPLSEKGNNSGEGLPYDSTASYRNGSAYISSAEDDRCHFDAQSVDRVQRRLKQRHVQMIAIAGTIGTGLFLGSGKALERAGPLGALLAYILIGSVAYSSLCSVGEMTCFAPISGTFPHYAARWVDPAFGFAVGWNYLYQQVITVPAEITAAAILISFWDDSTARRPMYIALILIFMCMINLFGVRYFGESEFVFSIIKLCLITGLILFGLIIDLGGGPDHDRIGFRYWRNPGAMNTYLVYDNVGVGRFLGFLGVLVQAAFSYQGMELVAIAASETESPRRNISKAVRRVFYRIFIFYILGILITGMLIPYNDPNLLDDNNNSKSTVAQSPYVIAMRRAGVSGLPHLVNACVFTSAFSSGNSYLFTSSRILYGLALRKQAPGMFARCTHNGLPLRAVLACSLFTLLAFLNVSNGSATVFKWLGNLTAIGGFFTWMAINLTYLRFYAGLKRQNIDRTKFVYYSSLQPWLSIWGFFWTSFCILINGFAVFWHLNASDFVTAYLNIPIFFGLYFGYKFWKKTEVWRTEDMDFVRGIPTIDETEVDYVPPETFWEKVFEKLF